MARHRPWRVVDSLRGVLHHLTLWVPNLARADESWTWLLGELGWTLEQSPDHMLLFRHANGSALALEQSPDMVPGMLYSRFRPGLNHLAFRVGDRLLTRRDHGCRARPRVVAAAQRPPPDRGRSPGGIPRGPRRLRGRAGLVRRLTDVVSRRARGQAARSTKSSIRSTKSSTTTLVAMAENHHRHL